MIWKTGDGLQIHITNLYNGHLINIIKYLESKITVYDNQIDRGKEGSKYVLNAMSNKKKAVEKLGKLKEELDRREKEYFPVKLLTEIPYVQIINSNTVLYTATQFYQFRVWVRDNHKKPVEVYCSYYEHNVIVDEEGRINKPVRMLEILDEAMTQLI